MLTCKRAHIEFLFLLGISRSAIAGRGIEHARLACIVYLEDGNIVRKDLVEVEPDHRRGTFQQNIVGGRLCSHLDGAVVTERVGVAHRIGKLYLLGMTQYRIAAG